MKRRSKGRKLGGREGWKRDRMREGKERTKGIKEGGMKRIRWGGMEGGKDVWKEGRNE